MDISRGKLVADKTAEALPAAAATTAASQAHLRTENAE